jgi:lambda family phage portal protein
MSLTVKISPTSIDTASVAVAPRSASLRRMSGRGFNAGRIDRLNGDWRVSNSSPNADYRNALAIVRQKARDLAGNDDFGKNYLRQVETNVIGPYGFSLKINPRERDEKFRTNARRIQDAFREWCRPEHCSATGEQSFVKMQRMLFKGEARDGEYTVRVIRSRKFKFGFALQPIPVEMLDEEYNTTLPGNRFVVMGIEYDRATLRRTAYYFKDIPLENQVYGYLGAVREHTRIPAEEIIHGYEQEYVNQSRGISWMVQSMESMRHLSAYDGATLHNARARAMTGGFLETTTPDADPFEGDGEDEEGNTMFEIEDGVWKQLPAGLKATYPKDEYPSAQFGPFTDKNLQRQSAGLGVAGSVHSGNYSDVNYSSERARQGAVRDNFMMMQQHFIESFLTPVAEIFLSEAWLKGVISYPAAEMSRYTNHVWAGRRWPYVNPEQEMAANKIKYELRTKSISEMITEGDGDYEPEEVFQMIADDMAMLKKLGIPLVMQAPAAPAAPAKPAEDPSGDPEEDAPKEPADDGEDTQKK